MCVTLSGRPRRARIGDSARLRACAGGVVARGRNADVFVLKYSASDGRGEWLKRLGQLDSHEEVRAKSDARRRTTKEMGHRLRRKKQHARM